MYYSVLFILVVNALMASPVLAATCDPSGVQACQQWARTQIQAKGCTQPSGTFENAVSDLYLNQGCRLQGTRWYNVATNADVKGSVSNGVNTDTAGCIERYTPASYRKTGGYFRTPKEAINSPLYNKSLSGCELSDANAVTAPVLAGIQSCACAASAAPKPVTTSVPPTLPTGGSAGTETQTEQPSAEPEATLQGNTDNEPFIAQFPPALQNQFRNLTKKYLNDIPTGTYGREANQDSSAFNFISAGSINNIFGENDTACGAYQGKILDWLEKMRKSTDPADQQLLEGFDFGPIQIAGGAHQAVVIFPKGTDWKSTGIVLDPWKEQKPKLYSIAGTDNLPTWCKLFWLGLGCPPKGAVGNIITPIAANTGHYPTTPNPDGSWKYQGARPGEVRKTPHGKIISIGSPVEVLLVSADGKRVGITATGEFVNDFGASVEAEMTSAPDGTYQTTFNAPDGNYTLQFTSTGAGDVHVWTRSDASGVTEFKPVRVTQGQQLTLAWSGTTPAFADQQGKPISTKAAGEESGSTISWMMILGIILALIVVIIIIVLIVRRGSPTLPPPTIPDPPSIPEPPSNPV